MFSNFDQSSVDLIHSDITSNLNLENGMELKFWGGVFGCEILIG